MATLTIRNLPDQVRDALRVRAAKNGRSMEAEVRALLEESAVESNDNELVDMSLPFSERLKQIRKIMRKHIPADVSLMDELEAERRREAERE